MKKMLWLVACLAPSFLLGSPDYGDSYPLKDGEYRLEASQLRYLAKCKEPIKDHSGKPVVKAGTYIMEIFLKGVSGKWVIVTGDASSSLPIDGQLVIVPKAAAKGTMMTLQSMQIVGSDFFIYPLDSL